MASHVVSQEKMMSPSLKFRATSRVSQSMAGMKNRNDWKSSSCMTERTYHLTLALTVESIQFNLLPNAWLLTAINGFATVGDQKS